MIRRVTLLAAVAGVVLTLVTAPAAAQGLGTGDVQITLRWSGDADLDLHVQDPFGDHVGYDPSTDDYDFAASGGVIDIDDQALCEGRTGSHVENVFWPFG